MIIMLVLLAIALLLAAGAIELWWNATARQRQRAAAEHTESRLNAPSPLPAQAGVPPAGMSGVTAPPRPSAQPALQSLPNWQAILRRANLRDHRQTWVWIVIPGIVLAVLAGFRMHSLVFSVLAVILYAVAAALWIHRRIQRQQQQMLQQLPDFLENMVRLAGTGTSLTMAFQMATAQVTAPLRPLLDNALIYARSGQDLDRALLQAGKPYNLQQMETLAVVLGTSLRIGGRSDQILQRMSDFLRDLEQVRQELVATTSETRMSAWVIGLLPPVCALFMALINPDFFQPMLSEALGHKLLLAALGMESVGALLLYRLAKSI